jgi:digeranylgeranylglycerophospholipid reductase
MKTDANFDVLVIGAGPAGSATAGAIAKYGGRVAMLERDASPGQRNVCGGGIEGADFEVLELPEALIQKRVTRREHHFPWGVTVVDLPHVTTLRRELDRWLAEQAVAAGAELFTRAQVRAVDREANRQIAVRAVDLTDHIERLYHARMVIFADGPNTLAPRSSNLGFVRTPTTAAVGLIYELDWPATPIDHYEIHFGPQLSPWGYLWLFPKRDLLNIGITMLPSKGQATRHLEERLQAFIESRPELRERRVLRRAGAHIPVVPAARVYDDAMLAVGDAAGMVDALTEGGIANAVLSGRLAAQATCEALAAGDFSAAFLSRYQRRWEATDRCRMVRFQSRLTRLLLPLSRLDENVYAKLMQILFMGGSMTRGQKARLLAYPLIRPPVTQR